MNPLASVRDYWRITTGVRDYARQPVPTNPIELIRRQVGEREDAWLSLVRRSIFNFANNPYRRMFELARCPLGDLESSVRGRGIEATLEELYDSGVYLTYDEFKGRLPIVRSGHEIESTASSFHNRHDAAWLDASTSGSSGQPTRVPQGTRAAPLRDAVGALAIKEFDLHNHKRMIVRPALPSSIGVLLGLSMSRLGCPMHQWYATGGSGRDSLHYRLLTQYLTYANRLSGATVPAPEYLRQGDFATPTKWIARQKDAGMPSMVSAFVSPAVRMAVLAKERGWDIGDSIFFTGGEALTPDKSAVLRGAGVHTSSRYWISELGPIGFGCRSMLNQNCMHLLHNSVAMIRRQRPAPFGQGDVDALLFTSVSPGCSSVLINAEMGDTATVQRTDCKCIFGQAGLGWEIRDVASYSKLTGQGMTLMGNDIIAILEHDLPRKFGGAPADYQLVERQRGNQTEIELRVSPRVGMSNPDNVRSELVKSLRSIYGGSLATRVWEHSGALRVVEEEPFATSNGKVPLLHLASDRAQNRDTHEP